MNFETIQDRLLEGNLHGEEVATFRNYVAVWLSYFYEQRGKSKVQGAIWIHGHRDDHKSHAACERAWETTEAGQNLTLLDERIRGYEKVFEVLTSLWFQLNKEERSAQGL